MALGTTGSVLRRIGGGTSVRALLLASIAAAGIAPRQAAAQAPPVMPRGGQVVGGSATIAAPSPDQLRITQTTQRAAIDWQSFSVGQGGHVQFQQPNASAIALNRVTGPDASVIAGRISANGQVAIVNQSGVVFTPTARVDAASIVASAAGISNENFMAGRMQFDQPARPGARVVNEGRITVAQGGLAALVAPEAANRGTIEARLGRVVIGGAETYALDLHGDGLLSIEVNRPSTVTGRPAASNTGTIAAEGGTVLITAEAASALVQGLVEAGGTVAAREGGRVTVAARDGEARVSGTIDVASSTARGGEITVTGRQATVAQGARLDASGATGGGRIRVGGDVQGGGTTPRAERSVVAQGATIRADATDAGPGGSVVVWADDAAFVHGTITARGGPHGGDGGFVETSGRRALGLAGVSIDTSAPRGATGTWLIDPEDLIIGPGPGTAVIDPVSLAAGLAINNVGLLTGDGEGGTGRISVTGAVTWTSSNTLTLTAAGGIVIDAPITAATGRLVLSAGAGETITQSALGAISVASLEASAPAGIALGNAANALPLVTGLASSGGPITLASSVAMTLGAAVTGPSDVSLSAPSLTTGAVTVGAGRTLSLTADTLSLSGDLSASGGRVAFAPFTAGTDVSLGGAGGGGLAITDAVIARVSTGTGTLQIGNGTGTGAITVADAVTIEAPQATGLDLRAGGAVTQAGRLSVSRLSASGTSVTLTDPENAITSLGTSATSTGAFSLSAKVPGDAALLVNGAVSSADAVSIQAVSGGIDLRAALSAATQTSLTAAGSITQNAAGRITAPSLSLAVTGAGSAVALATAANAVPRLAGASIGAGGGDFAFRTTTALDVGGAVTVPGAASMTAGGELSQSAGITATSLTVSAGSDGLALDHAANAFGTLAGASAAGGQIVVLSASDLAVTGAVSGSTVWLESTGAAVTTTLAAPVTATTGAAVIEASGAVSLAASVSGAAGVSIEGATVSTASLASSAGDIGVTAGTSASIGSASAAGGFSIMAPTVSLGPAAAGAGRTITLEADSLTATGTLTAAGGTIAVRPMTSGRTVTLGGAGGGLVLPGSFIGFVNAGAGTLSVGSADTGAIAIAGPVDLTGRAGRLELTSGAGVSQSASLAVSRLQVDADGPIALGLGANTIATVDGARGTGAIAIASTSSLTIEGTVSGTGISLTSGGGIAIDAPVDAGAGTLTLSAQTAVTQSAQGVVTAARLTGTAGTLALDDAANAIGQLASFSATADDLALSVTGPLSLAGTISAQGVLTLEAGGAIAADPGTSLAAARLAGSAAGGADLGSVAHAIATFGGWSDAAGGFAMHVAGPLQIAGDITLAGPLSLTAGGEITQQGGTSVTAASLAGGSIGGTVLANAGNAIGGIGGWSDATGDLTVATTTGLDITGAIGIAGTLDLAAASITQAAAAPITAPRVTAEAPGGLVLDAPGNSIGEFGAVAASSGDVRLATTLPLRLLGPAEAAGTLALSSGGTITQSAPVKAGRLEASATGGIILADPANEIASTGDVTNAGAGTVTLRTATDLAIDGRLATPGALLLTVAGAITEGAAGAVEAATLSGTSTGGATLGRAANRVGTLEGWTNTGGGGFTFASTGALTVAGPVNAGAGVLSLNTQGGPITLAANLTTTGPAGIRVVSGTTLTAGDHVYAAPIIEFRALSAGTPVTIQAGEFRASDRVVLAATGSITFEGSTRIVPLAEGNRPAVVISVRNGNEPTDATRVRPDQAGLADLAQFTQIESFPLPTGGSANTLALGSSSLIAPTSPLFLLLDRGSATGTIDVARLGLVIFGGSTDLSGCVAGVCGANAASLGRTTDPSALARLNNCPVSSPNCFTLPTTVTYTDPQPRELPTIVAERRGSEIDLPLSDVAEEEE
ncbi:two-partner secretion domain-containing protein [Elioraea rosea]|uniref:two-partner secretion domain-containing protein n=1 Tax=Elioraea rosea TaxID=2492390 RepID=UPI0013152EA4|nr:filamentous hemagglutinin N-terminal domain-containing protein [Elioraea rosea]